VSAVAEQLWLRAGEAPLLPQRALSMIEGRDGASEMAVEVLADGRS